VAGANSAGANESLVSVFVRLELVEEAVRKLSGRASTDFSRSGLVGGGGTGDGY
jgi:hypothetical protein